MIAVVYTSEAMVFFIGLKRIPGTDWFKHIASNLLNIQCPRRFLEVDPQN